MTTKPENRNAPPPVRKQAAAKPKPKPRAPKVEKPAPRPDQPEPMRLVAGVALAIVLLDQTLKYWVVHVLRLDRVREIDLLPPWLNLRMAWNQGMNFGLMSSESDLTRWMLISVAAVICIWVWVWLSRSDLGRLPRIAGGLLIGGAIGNVIDRLLYGAVSDFLNMSLPGWQNPYSFNVADISIFAGAIGLILTPSGEKDHKTRDEPRKSR